MKKLGICPPSPIRMLQRRKQELRICNLEIARYNIQAQAEITISASMCVTSDYIDICNIESQISELLASRKAAEQSYLDYADMASSIQIQQAIQEGTIVILRKDGIGVGFAQFQPVTELSTPQIILSTKTLQAKPEFPAIFITRLVLLPGNFNLESLQKILEVIEQLPGYARSNSVLAAIGKKCYRMQSLLAETSFTPIGMLGITAAGKTVLYKNINV